MKIALLSRVSTSKQENENQLLDLRAFATKQGWEVIAEYCDVVSGSGKKARVEFDRMMVDASQRKFDLVLFWKLDRFSREGVRKTLRYLQQLDDWGVGWRSYQEPFFDSCGMMRDVVISIMSALAAQERITISERTKSGLRRARQLGHIPGPKAFTVDMDDVQRRRAGGASLRSIARTLKISPALLHKRFAMMNVQPA